ncbi:MAG: hypothetical protein IKJ88_09305 [Clostridia bacterium]|nr:hypothetical protein [Clostridia bacterium]MBR3976040.1 hypothetical protein [Clostridia bacterium]
MGYKCVCCDYESDEKREFIDVRGVIEPTTICKDCTSVIDFTTVYELGREGNLNALKRYIEVYPEAQPKLDRFIERLKEYYKEHPYEY